MQRAIRTSLQPASTSRVPASNQHPSLHPLGNAATPARDRPRPQLRVPRSIGSIGIQRLQRLSSRQFPNGSCRLAHFGTRMSREATQWAAQITSRPTGYGVRYIGPLSDSFIFHFLLTRSAGVPDLVCSRHPDKGADRKRAVDTLIPVTKRVYPSPFDLAARPRRGPPARIYLAFDFETAFLSPSSSPFPKQL